MSVKTLAAAFGLAATATLGGCAIGVNPYGQISVTPAPVYASPYYRQRAPVYVRPPVYYAPPAPRYYIPAPVYVQPRPHYYQQRHRQYGPHFGW